MCSDNEDTETLEPNTVDLFTMYPRIDSFKTGLLSVNQTDLFVNMN